MSVMSKPNGIERSETSPYERNRLGGVFMGRDLPYCICSLDRTAAGRSLRLWSVIPRQKAASRRLTLVATCESLNPTLYEGQVKV